MYLGAVKNSMLKEWESRLLDLCVLDCYLYPWFDYAFVSFYPRVWFQWKKELYYLFTAFITYLLPWGWSVEWKTLLYTDQPQEGKKHVYIFADCDNVPVMVII